MECRHNVDWSDLLTASVESPSLVIISVNSQADVGKCTIKIVWGGEEVEICNSLIRISTYL